MIDDDVHISLGLLNNQCNSNYTNGTCSILGHACQFMGWWRYRARVELIKGWPKEASKMRLWPGVFLFFLFFFLLSCEWQCSIIPLFKLLPFVCMAIKQNWNQIILCSLIMWGCKSLSFVSCKRRLLVRNSIRSLPVPMARNQIKKQKQRNLSKTRKKLEDETSNK